MDTLRLCACISLMLVLLAAEIYLSHEVINAVGASIVLMLALLAAEIYLSREVILVAKKLLDPPGR